MRRLSSEPDARRDASCAVQRYICRQCQTPLRPGQQVYTSDGRPFGDPLKALFCSARCGYAWDAVGVFR
jgi:RNase P subunit RPR2